MPTTNKSARTMQQLCEEAMLVQDACNASGVAAGMHRALCDLKAYIPNTGKVNRHPVARLWAAKLADLAGLEYAWPAEAWKWCKDYAAELVRAQPCCTDPSCPHCEGSGLVGGRVDA